MVFVCRIAGATVFLAAAGGHAARWVGGPPAGSQLEPLQAGPGQDPVQATQVRPAPLRDVCTKPGSSEDQARKKRCQGQHPAWVSQFQGGSVSN